MHQQEELVGAKKLRSSRKTNLLCANAWDLIQNGKIYIKVDSLSLVSFSCMLVWQDGTNLNPISNIYIFIHICTAQYHILTHISQVPFSQVCWLA